jgi:phosphatidylglycerophosphate synthase
MPHGRVVSALPNMVSLSRFVMAPLMVVAAMMGSGFGFTALYAACLFTDAADGFLARMLHAESKLGSTLDSRGDLAVALALPIGAFQLWPVMMRGIIPYVVAALCAYLAPTVVGVFRYGRLASFHTWGAKTMAVVAGLALLMMFITQNTLWFRLCVPLLILESAEELIMIAILPKWHPNVPSLWHALKLR